MTEATPVTTPFVPAGIMSVPEIAGAAEKIVKDVMKVEPMIAGIAGMFIPGLSLVQPWIVMVAPYLERALDDLATSKNGDVLSAFLELIQHLTKGQPNSPILEGPPSTGQFKHDEPMMGSGGA